MSIESFARKLVLNGVIYKPDEFQTIIANHVVHDNKH